MSIYVQCGNSSYFSWMSDSSGFIQTINFLLESWPMDSRQLLGIDAHNYHPDAPAMFGAMYSRDLPGHGPLYLDWVALNQDRGMVGLAAIANVDFNDDLEGV